MDFIMRSRRENVWWCQRLIGKYWDVEWDDLSKFVFSHEETLFIVIVVAVVVVVYRWMCAVWRISTENFLCQLKIALTWIEKDKKEHDWINVFLNGNRIILLFDRLSFMHFSKTSDRESLFKVFISNEWIKNSIHDQVKCRHFVGFQLLLRVKNQTASPYKICSWFTTHNLCIVKEG